MPQQHDHRVCSRDLADPNPCITGDVVLWLINALDTTGYSFARLIGTTRQLLDSHAKKGQMGPFYNALYDLIHAAVKRHGPEVTFNAMDSCRSLPQLLRALAWLTTSEDELVIFMKTHVGRDIRGLPST